MRTTLPPASSIAGTYESYTGSNTITSSPGRTQAVTAVNSAWVAPAVTVISCSTS